MSIRVVIVDDHRLMRYGLRMALKEVPAVEVVGEASNAGSALDLIRRERPYLVILDIQLPDASGIEVARTVHTEFPSMRTLFISGSVSEGLVQEAMQTGASGFIRKEESQHELLRAITAILEGKRYLCPSSSTMLLAAQDSQRDLGPAQVTLTEREQQLLRLICQGLRNKEIADEMDVSVKSIESYRSRLMKKTCCQSPAELVRFALRIGLSKP